MNTIILHINNELTHHYFVATGDYSHLNEVCINSGDNMELEEELVNLLMDSRGSYKLPEITHETAYGLLSQGYSFILTFFIL